MERTEEAWLMAKKVESDRRKDGGEKRSIKTTLGGCLSRSFEGLPEAWRRRAIERREWTRLVEAAIQNKW